MAQMKPPPNSILDPKVAARRQKDLDGYTDQYQDLLEARAAKYGKEIRPTFERMGRSTTREFKAIYNKVQDASGVKIVDADNIGKEKLQNMLRKQAHTASLQAQIVKELGTAAQVKKARRNIAHTYAHSYYFTGFSMEQAAQVAVNVPILDYNQVMGVVANPWVGDGNTYSDRIRANTGMLAKKMTDTLEETVANGWDTNRMARRIQDVAGEGYHNSVRLARTEMQRAASTAASQSYMQNADIMSTKRWNAVLDAKTAPKDAHNDGKEYPLEYDTEEIEGFVGQRIPNHPNCRCKWSPVLDALGVSTKERIARGEGASTEEFGERTYTEARDYREYAKERGLPDLDERLANDNPSSYLRRGESLPEFIEKKTRATNPAKVMAKTGAATAERVKERIAQGIAGEADIQEVGEIMQADLEERLTEAGVPKLQGELNTLQDEIKGTVKELHKRADLSHHYTSNPKHSEYVELLTAYRTKSKQREEVGEALQKLRSNTTKQLLQDIRPVGNPGTTPWAARSSVEVKKVVDEVSNYLPSAWLKASNAGGTMKAKIGKRGYYRPGRPSEEPRLNIDAEYVLSGGKKAGTRLESVTFHELGHRFEEVVPGIVALEKEFYQRRTKGEALEWMGSGYRRNEVTRKDEFINPYMGKDYGGNFFELLSMGLEGVFTGRIDIATDPDYYNFILGVLATQ